MVLNIASQGVGTEYTAPLEFMQNLVDWSLEDSGLLSIRSRAQLARILYPMDESKRRTFEYGNYAAVLVGLFLVWLMRLILNKRKYLKYKQYLAEI